jgi:hypothetical protein
MMKSEQIDLEKKLDHEQILAIWEKIRKFVADNPNWRQMFRSVTRQVIDDAAAKIPPSEKSEREATARAGSLGFDMAHVDSRGW